MKFKFDFYCSLFSFVGVRTESPDNDSGFSDNASLLSSGSSLSASGSSSGSSTASCIGGVNKNGAVISHSNVLHATEVCIFLSHTPVVTT